MQTHTRIKKTHGITQQDQTSLYYTNYIMRHIYSLHEYILVESIRTIILRVFQPRFDCIFKMILLESLDFIIYLFNSRALI